jgi:hypothetical protein
VVHGLLTLVLYYLTWFLLRGGGPGDSVNLASISSTHLSQEYVSHLSRWSAYSNNIIPCRWRKLIANIIGPKHIASQPDDAPYVTNLTRAVTLVCDPHLQLIPKLARAFEGFVNLDRSPAEYGKGVGNIDQTYLAWMVYNYAIQQSLDTTGRFRSYTLIGHAIGNATLRPDHNDPIGGTVPKAAAEIGSTLV